MAEVDFPSWLYSKYLQTRCIYVRFGSLLALVLSLQSLLSVHIYDGKFAVSNSCLLAKIHFALQMYDAFFHGFIRRSDSRDQGKLPAIRAHFSVT